MCPFTLRQKSLDGEVMYHAQGFVVKLHCGFRIANGGFFPTSQFAIRNPKFTISQVLGWLVEVFGGVSLANVRAIANTGIERISIGRLTHSALSLDVSLEVVR